MRHLVDRFGERQVLDFIESVLRQGRPPQEAARQHYGVDWTVLREDRVS